MKNFRIANIACRIAAVTLGLAFGHGAANAQAFACIPAELIGLWRAQVVTDAPWDVTVNLTFQFQPEGTYSYVAGQGGFRWTFHQGTFAIGRNTGPSSRSYPCLIRLTPNPSTVWNNPQNKLGLMPLQARNLMDDQEHTFRVQPIGSRLVLHDMQLDWRDVGMFSIGRAGN